MIYEEYIKPNEKIEVLHNNSGLASIIYQKDKHVYLFPSLIELFKYLNGDEAEKIYVSEHQLNKLIDNNIYGYQNQLNFLKTK